MVSKIEPQRSKRADRDALSLKDFSNDDLAAIEPVSIPGEVAVFDDEVFRESRLRRLALLTT